MELGSPLKLLTREGSAWIARRVAPWLVTIADATLQGKVCECLRAASVVL